MDRRLDLAGRYDRTLQGLADAQRSFLQDFEALPANVAQQSWRVTFERPATDE